MPKLLETDVKMDKEDEEILTHYGMADASSAIAIGDDRFLVVSDEKNVFQLYSSESSGEYLDEFSFSSFINIDHRKDEADIEGSATIGDITYWIGSHSRTGAGAFAPARHQLFATIIRDKRDHVRIKQVGRSYSGLLYDLMRTSEFADLTVEDLSAGANSDLSPKSPHAISIEGLSAAGNSLLIGFRNPIPNYRALVVPLLNPLEVVLYGEGAVFGKFIYLDLKGHGVRSIDYWPEREEYLIVAGAADSRRDFQYFSWSGSKREKPQRLRSHGLDVLNPEALVFYEGINDRMHIISDDGGKLKGVKKSKRTLSFRSVWVTL